MPTADAARGLPAGETPEHHAHGASVALLGRLILAHTSEAGSPYRDGEFRRLMEATLAYSEGTPLDDLVRKVGDVHTSKILGDLLATSLSGPRDGLLSRFTPLGMAVKASGLPVELAVTLYMELEQFERLHVTANCLYNLTTLCRFFTFPRSDWVVAGHAFSVHSWTEWGSRFGALSKADAATATRLGVTRRDIEQAICGLVPDPRTVDLHTRFIMGLVLRHLLLEPGGYYQVERVWGNTPGIFSEHGVMRGDLELLKAGVAECAIKCSRMSKAAGWAETARMLGKYAERLDGAVC
ncbi:hypothetical protein COCSUDRAFT_52721 [Coccomyxa subellipsoidea C-169]|uniref:Uncharacterized protein n=1 Tax=Coccomyxa subellipsoidea (strain C-169) TaxID=574566 RepID=I0Z6F1_COCSC|nr:hypothetical protein COCSUDRAFT_52721 [Coccomyxa subellipsoidea C-169]EIE26220.1 hypothetical protein COCSUDRAFT_52721 [Coccomyxa subellipsoidea C-169]|eukprot:XP_005650764.1 hypothetical protein COCSUDRAFT_52721 [Coccomyxa subellipsoidea C-169]